MKTKTIQVQVVSFKGRDYTFKQSTSNSALNAARFDHVGHIDGLPHPHAASFQVHDPRDEEGRLLAVACSPRSVLTDLGFVLSPV